MDDNREGRELSSAKMSRGGQSDAQPTDFRPDDRAKRSEFSLHIGCSAHDGLYCKQFGENT